ncbi:MAG TPA: isocitrate lyase/phosphoenolpyruvate mutase family protein [Ohtaekwangia sp.]|uniref:isocitrate lyase/PEP mutase family protein n=1 Tax=Ohtaekwangia sp. TaxID=2066019 RepID=UPI002F935189
MNLFEVFSQLHQQATPLLLGNIWDVNSAQAFEASQYKAIATSSQAVAKSLGYEDGEQLPFEVLLRLARRVVEVVRIPFSVDIEAGYSRSLKDILANIEQLHDAGVVGINLEDTIPGATRQLRAAADFQKDLTAIADYLSRNNINLFINVRTDGFLLGMPNALQETLDRIRHYENAGADGIFVPCITDKHDIEQVVKATHLPVNVMCMPDLPDFKELASLGVKRISMGPFVHIYANKKVDEALRSIASENSFSALFK